MDAFDGTVDGQLRDPVRGGEELDLILKGENESMKLSKMYATANATCRFCRTQRVFNFDTINYCDGCMLAHFVGEIEDSVGED